MSLKNINSFGLPENKKDTILLTHYSYIYIYLKKLISTWIKGPDFWLVTILSPTAMV